ncbi:MAG TPA: aldo/keto reductase [Terriglobia bacterium]|nr:aldo/keto reductase [Terriglobia bacterium]
MRSGGQQSSLERGDIPKRVFGKTGERLTIAGQAGGRFSLCGYEEAKAVTIRAYELGVNYFDTARIYWEGKSEQVFGEVLAPFRKHIFLTTKSPQRSRQGAEADLEKSLRALNTDYVDLSQIHQVSTMDEVQQIFATGGAIEAFEAAKKAGKCRFIGFTGHHDTEVHPAMLKRYDKYDSILMPLNPADRPGGSGWSKSQFNNTGRLAAQAGFGLFHPEPDSYFYLDRDLALDMIGIAPQVGTTSYDRLSELHPERWLAHPDGPAMLLFHDRDIALQPDFVERLLTALPASYQTLSVNKYIGILHAQITSLATDSWQFTFDFDPHYCAYFERHSSSWKLWLSDPFREKLKTLQDLSLSVDRQPPSRIKASDFLRGTAATIDLPAGLPTHGWELTAAR